MIKQLVLLSISVFFCFTLAGQELFSKKVSPLSFKNSAGNSFSINKPLYGQQQNLFAFDSNPVIFPTTGISSKKLRTEKRFYLVNTLKPSKKVRVPDDVIVVIGETNKRKDELSRYTYIDCRLDSLARDSVKIILINEEIEIEHNNYFTTISNSYYIGDYNNIYRNVNVNDISYVSMKSPFRKSMLAVGRTLMTISIIALVVSPFSAFDLEGEARAQRRNKIFLTGASGVVIAIPFFIMGKNKKYAMSESYPAKKHWQMKMTYE